MLRTEYTKIKFISMIAVAITALVITAAYSQKISHLFNLTTRINTSGDDYAPSITEDGGTAVFNSRMPGERSHNIFICKNINGLWSDPYPIFEINSDSNDETPFISADGKIILFASDRPGGYSPPLTSDGKKRITFDIYISRFVNEKWTFPEILKGTVNTNMNERAPGLSTDGKTLFFTRWPYNNPGRSKIYSAKLDEDGFTDEKKLPESINTGNFEIGFRPSYKSGKYYFASMKTGGYGGWDIYYTTLTSKGFTAPVNAGEEINSPFDEIYYSDSKNNSVLCSNRRGGLGKFDLYSSMPAEKTTEVALKKEYKKSLSPIIKITVRDKTDGRAVKNSLFKVLLLGEKEKESLILRKIKIKSDIKGVFTLYPKDDVDSVVIEPISKYYSECGVRINVAQEIQDISLFLSRETASGKKQNPCRDEKFDPEDYKRAVNNSTKLHLNIIYFKFDSAAIATDYIPELHSLVEFLRGNPEFSVTISGYTDPAGPAESNYKLSMKRAMNVADFIKSFNIAENRITVKWFGESKATSSQKGPRYYSLDRKVEILLEK